MEREVYWYYDWKRYMVCVVKECSVGAGGWRRGRGGGRGGSGEKTKKGKCGRDGCEYDMIHTLDHKFISFNSMNHLRDRFCFRLALLFPLLAEEREEVIGWHRVVAIRTKYYPHQS